MAKKNDPTGRITQALTSEMDKQTPRLASVLEGDFQGPDRQSTSTANWHDIIRSNWADPMWRQQQAVRVGPVSLVSDAMKAFGVDPKLLKTVPTPPAPTPTLPAPNPASPPLAPPQGV